MPQLDLTAFITQLFWVSLALSLIYMVLYLFIIPHTLRALRVRDKLVKAFSNISKSDTLSLQNKVKDDWLTNLNDINGLLKQRDSVAKLYTDRKLDHINDTKDMLLQRKLYNLTTAIKYSKQRSAWVGIFASVIAPTDEFILLLCFLLFAIIFFSLAGSYLGIVIDSKIVEIKDRFLTILSLKKEHSGVRLTILEEVRGLDADTRNLLVNLLSDLEVYNKVSEQAYAQVKLKTSFLKEQLNLETAHNAQFDSIIEEFYGWKRPRRKHIVMRPLFRLLHHKKFSYTLWFDTFKESELLLSHTWKSYDKYIKAALDE